MMPSAAEWLANGKSFEMFKAAWHKEYQAINQPADDSMYWDGQIDELPYMEWENAGGVCYENFN